MIQFKINTNYKDKRTYMSTHNNLEENVLNKSLYKNKNDLINYTKIKMPKTIQKLNYLHPLFFFFLINEGLHLWGPLTTSYNVPCHSHPLFSSLTILIPSPPHILVTNLIPLTTLTPSSPLSFSCSSSFSTATVDTSSLI